MNRTRIIFFVIVYGGVKLYTWYDVTQHTLQAEIADLLRKANDAESENRYEDARKYFEMILEKDPDDRIASQRIKASHEKERNWKTDIQDLVTTMLKEAQQAYERGAFQIALNKLDVVAKYDPENNKYRIMKFNIDEALKSDEQKKQERKREREKQIREMFEDAEYAFHQGEYEAAKRKCLEIMFIQSDHLATIELMKQIDKKLLDNIEIDEEP